MKYLKSYKKLLELKTSTYLSAGEKLSKLGHTKRSEELINHVSILFNNEDNEEAWVPTDFIFYDHNGEYIENEEYDIDTYLSKFEDELYPVIYVSTQFYDPYTTDSSNKKIFLEPYLIEIHFMIDEIMMTIHTVEMYGCILDRKNSIKFKNLLKSELIKFNEITDNMLKSAIFEIYGHSVCEDFLNLKGFKVNGLYNDKGKLIDGQNILTILTK